MRLRILLKSIGVVLFAWFIIHEVTIIYDGLTDEREKKEFAVILGTTVHKNGQVSDRLKARLDAGLKLYKDSLVDKLFVSGGLGKEGHLEGTKMKEYLTSNGVSSLDVIIDNEGNNTRFTALNFSKAFPDCKSVVVVSQFFHVSRTKLAFEQLGLNNVTGVHADYHEWRDVYSTLREFFGYYMYLIFY